MAEIKLNVGDPKSKKTITLVVSEEDAKSLHGKKLGDTIKGEVVDKAGYEFEITGGSDNAGFPMRRDAPGTGRRQILVTRSTGQQKTQKGTRIRKTVAGNTVGDQTHQINVRVTKHGKAPLVEEAPAESAE